MSKVSEKPLPPTIGARVRIIPKQFIRHNSTIDDMSSYSTDDSQFLEGTLLSKTIISTLGYGGNVEYTVQIKDSTLVTFQSATPQYYFKIYVT
jgi:hypothetical protein